MLIKQLKRLILAVSAFILTQPLMAQSGLVVNEFSQGSSGEWIELVVVGDCEVDLRGWIIDDNNGIFTDCGAGNNIEHGTFSGHGVAAGHLKFSNNATWSAVKEGTIIVVYANNAFTGTLPTGEPASTGDPTDANCDLLRWCPINSANSAYFDQNSVSPTSGGSTGCDCTTNNAPQGNFSYAPGGLPVNNGSWASVGLRNDGDGIQVRQPDATFFHGFSYGSPGGSCGTTFGGGPDGLHFATSGASITYQFRNTTSDDYSVLANFQALTAGSNQSPGEANTCANATWINNMRYPAEDFFYPTCSPAVTTYDICQGQTATIGIPFTTCINSSWSLGTVSGSPLTAFPVPGSLDAVNGTIDVTGLLPGSITVTLIATQDNSGLFPGCPNLTQTSEVGITINVGPGPTANTAFIIACEESGGGAIIDLTTQDPTVGGGLQVDWFSDSGATSPIANPTAFSAPTGSSSVWAVAVDGLCVSDPVQVTIAVTQAPSANSANITDCAAPGATQETVDLTSLENTITGGNTSNNVTFYTNPTATNLISTPVGYTVNVGVLTTVYAVVDDGSCSSSPVPVVINIFPTPNLVANGSVTICEGDQVDLSNLVTETTGSGAVLTYYGNGSCTGSPISNIQTPTTAGANFFCVQATTGICQDEQQIVVLVTPAGDPILGDTVLCETDPIFDLTQLEDPLLPGGTWTGTGVSGTNFDPSNLNGIFTLTYTPVDCGNPGTTTVEVVAAGTPILGTASLCSTDGAFDLTTLADPIYPTGTWSGNYVSGNIFDPSQASSNETVTLTFAPSSSCASTVTTTIDITLSETPVLNTISLCETDAVVDLTTLEDTNYPGGTWSGPGVSNNEFDPTNQSGDITLTYSPTASGQCVLDATTIITVDTVETPALVSASTCLTTTDFDLTTLEDPNFPGGTWSGAGVTGTIFDATGQTGSVTLDYVANESCTALSSTTITVIDAPIADVVTELCNAANTEYTVTIEISGGDNTSYTIDGNPVVGNTFISAPIPTGSSYSFILDDANNCNPVTISGSFTCNCDTDAGSIDFSTAISICDSTAIDVSSLYNNDFFNDGDDTLNFVIHDAPDASLGNIIATSINGVFNYPTGIPLNTVVYISPIAGNSDASGIVDINDPCLSIAQGVAVEVTSPDITFTVTDPICEEECIPVTINIGNTDVSPSNPLNINYTLSDGPNEQFGLITLESDTTVTIEICESETLAPGLVSLSFTDAELNGCTIDYGTSQTTLLDILAPGVRDITDTLCENDTLIILGAIFDINQPSGELTLGGQAFNGCDSVININLNFFDPDTTIIDQILCTGGELEVNGTIYNELNPSGVELISGGNINGCDSIIVVNVSFLDAVINEIDSTLCEGDTLTLNNVVYDYFNTTGMDTIVGGSWLGCDSIIDVDLTFIDSIITVIDTTLCIGESIEVNNVVYNTATTASEIMTAVSGCDSIININLAYYADAVGAYSETICANGSVMVGDSIFDANNLTGSVILPNASINGCDSTVNVTISIFPDAIGAYSETICSDESIMVGDSIFDANNLTGSVTLTAASVNGCDSIVDVTISIFPDAIGVYTETICSNESIMVGDSIFDANNLTGSVTLTDASVNGCDSIVDVTISLFPDALGIFSDTICSSESIMVGDSIFDANNLTGLVTLTGASSNGCDSIVDVTISLFPDAIGVYTETICSDESIMVGDSIFDANNLTGLVTLTGASSNGCDSIVDVTISLFPDAIGVYTETICSNESTMVGDSIFDANNLTGLVTLTGASSNGCDSIVDVTISLFPDNIGIFEDTICSDESIMVGDSIFDANNLSGTVILSGQSFFGCDSTVDVTISIYEDAIEIIDIELQSDETIVVNGVEYSVNNPTGQEIISNGSLVTGCDSIININLSFIFEIESILSTVSPSCPGFDDGIISIEDIENLTLPVSLVLTGPSEIGFYEIDSYPFNIDTLIAGTYNLSYVDVAGMVYSENVFINDPSPYFINAGGPYEVELGGSQAISITPTFNLESVIWTPSLYLNCDTCTTVTATPEEGITYEVIAVNEEGCEATTTVIVDVFNNREVFIPNVFSPDADGINDVFTVYAGNSVQNIEILQVFDRWGNLVYEANNLDPMNLNVGWDGRYRGDLLNPGVFAYYTIVEYLDGEREIFKGDVTLIR